MKIYEHSRIILGMMRLNPVTPEDLEKVIRGCLDLGIDYFDTSDVYCRHQAEAKLGAVLEHSPELRSRMFLQSKVGILKEEGLPMYYDLSYQHIIEGVNASLSRLHTTYLDCLLLHRPDIFMDSKEVAKAVNQLVKEGKIRHFGVSNEDASTIDYLQSELSLPIEIDQLQCGLGQAALLSGPVNANNPNQTPWSQDGLYFYLKRKDMALQCWSPFIYKFFQGSIFTVPEMKPVQDKLAVLAEKYHSTPSGIATSFLTSLSPTVQVLSGSMNLEHIKESVEGAKITLSRPDWYDLYAASGNLVP